MMNVPRMRCHQWRRITVPSGNFLMTPFSSAFTKVSDSTRRRRTQRPMMTITAENRNGTRHPHSRNACDR